MTVYTATANGQTFDLTGADDTVVLGNYTNVVVRGANAPHATISAGNGDDSLEVTTGDTVTAGNGRNFIAIAHGASNVLIAIGNGDDTISTAGGNGNLTINAGTGDDTLSLEGATGNIAFGQAAGAGVDYIDLSNSTLSSVDLTIGNPADVIYDSDDKITTFTINVATDGFKLPDGDASNLGVKAEPTANVVNYLDTPEVINAAYAQAVPLPYFIDKLLFSPTPHWNTGLGQPLTIEFSFMQTLYGYQSDDATRFEAIGGNLPAGLSPSQLLADNAAHLDGVSLNTGGQEAIQALAAWEAVADVTFISEPDGPAVPFRIGSNNQGSASGGYSYVAFPGTSGALLANGSEPGDSSVDGDVFVNNDLSIEPVSDWGRVFIHEFGHVLGLGGESGNGDPYDILPGGVLDSGGGQDSAVYTVMSYDNPPGSSNTAIITPQIYDIAVAQYLYGADPTFDANPSHVWTFSATPYNASSQTAQNTANLIDGAGGADDIIAAGSWSGVGSIDLRPGHWSRLGTLSIDTAQGFDNQPNILAPDQLFIDYGTVVDGIDAHLTSGSMTLVCNDGDDSITCGSGNDLIVVAGSGVDSILGGIGDDTVLFASARADYSIADTGGIYTVTAAAPAYGGTVVMSDVDNLAFTDQTVAAAEQIDLSLLSSAQFAAIPAAQLAALSTTVLATMTTSEAAQLSSAQVQALTAPGIEALGPSIFDQLNATQFAAIAPAPLGQLPSSQIAALSAARIAEITVSQLSNMRLAALGELTVTEVAELSTSQLAGLNAAALHGLGATNLDAMSTTQLTSLTTTQFAGLNASAIAGLSVTGVASLATSVIASLNRTQVSALTATELGVLTASQLGALGTGELAILSTTQLSGLGAAQVGTFSTTQIQALTTTGIGALSQAQIYGLTNQEVASLTTAQVQALMPGEMLGLSANQLMAFSTGQLGAMSSVQLAVIFG